MIAQARVALPLAAASAAAILGLCWQGLNAASSDAAAVTSAPPTLQAAVAVPDLPAPLDLAWATALDDAGQQRMEQAPPASSFFDPASPMAGVAFRPAMETPVTGQFVPVATAAVALEQATGVEGTIRREIARRDTTLSALDVRPPPRPAFPAARVKLASVDDRALDLQGMEPQGRPEGSGSFWSLFDSAPPAADADRWNGRGRGLQTGMASWYGPGFHGRKTASGERFDQNAMTAAHRTLPFGTRVRVVDVRTGRSVVVRINDRGPFAHGRIIDLSRGSAQALGAKSTVPVRLVSVTD